MYCEMDIVVLFGLFLVMFMILLKICKVLIVDVMDVNRIIGLSNGIVILKN